MEWWQIVFIVVGAVAVGLGAGFFVNLAIVKIAPTVNRSARRPVRQPIVSSRPERAAPAPSVPDLFAEIEHNRKIATGEWNGDLQPFVTRAWDNRGDEVHSLPPDVRTELAEAYSDMALANSITWLSTEMARRSPSLDESYTKLRSSVGGRLNRIHMFLSET